MAKMSMKKEDVQQFLLAHCEKLVVCIVGVLVLLFLWSSMTQEGMPPAHNPSDIATLASQADSAIKSERNSWEDFPNKPREPKYVIELSELPEYPVKTAFDPPIFESKQQRFDPALFPIEQLRAHADQGAFAVAQTTATSAGRNPNAAAVPKKAEGRRWVVVTGVVPFMRQVDEYLRTFQDAMGYEPNADRPEYIAYYVERREVKPGGEPTDWKQHEIVSPRSLAKVVERWNKQTVELVDNRYVEPNLTFPLGPRLLKQWGTESVHPAIPSKFNADQNPADASQGKASEDGSQPANPFEMARRDPRSRTSRSSDEEGTKPAETRLFRYFDFNKVVPGMTYQYRFRLVLRDPNYEYRSPQEPDPVRVPEKFLAPVVVERIKSQDAKLNGYRIGPWSEATEAITVPSDSQVVSLAAKPPGKRFNEEPSAKIAVEMFEDDRGVSALGAISVERGDLLNFTVADMQQEAEDRRGRGRRDEGQQLPVTATDPLEGQAIALPPEFEFRTDAIVLDIRGGDSMRPGSSLKSPGEVLLLDANGNLTIRRELDGDLKAASADDPSHPAPQQDTPTGGLLGGGGLLN